MEIEQPTERKAQKGQRENGGLGALSVCVGWGYVCAFMVGMKFQRVGKYIRLDGKGRRKCFL